MKYESNSNSNHSNHNSNTNGNSNHCCIVSIVKECKPHGMCVISG